MANIVPKQLRKSALLYEGQTVRVQAKCGWRELRQTARIPDWLPRYAKIRTAFCEKFGTGGAQT